MIIKAWIFVQKTNNQIEEKSMHNNMYISKQYEAKISHFTWNV